jgi:hypothetical protein
VATGAVRAFGIVSVNLVGAVGAIALCSGMAMVCADLAG